MSTYPNDYYDDDFDPNNNEIDRDVDWGPLEDCDPTDDDYNYVHDPWSEDD